MASNTRSVDCSAGFTLMEVLVALVIMAFGISAALAALSSAADSVSRLRDKSCAQWIGFNQIATARLALQLPAIGTTTGELDFGTGHWYWQQVIEETAELPGVQRLTVKVRRAGALGATAAVDQSSDQEWLATTIGFRGTALSASNGEQPDWNGPRTPPGAAVGAGNGGGGRDGDGGGGGGRDGGGGGGGDSNGNGSGRGGGSGNNPPGSEP